MASISQKITTFALSNMRHISATILFSLLIAAVAMPAQAQTEKKSVRRGNKAYAKQDYVESEVQYRKALEQNAHSIKGQYNLAAALYKQEKYEESAEANGAVNASGMSAANQSKLLYNQANSLFKQEKYQESVKLYKQAVKLNPNDMEARYNLSEALRKLQQQNNGGGGDGQNDQDNQDNKDNQQSDSQNDQNQGDNEQDKQNQDNQDKQDENKDNKDNQDQQNQQNQQDKQGQNQPQPKISKFDAERMLEALQQNDKDLQDKMNAQRRKAATAKPLKNW